MSLLETRAKFRSGALDKLQYAQAMQDLHQRLFEYAHFIRDTGISRIDISDGNVILVSRGLGIKMLCDQKDMRLTPMTILNFGHYETAEFNMLLRLIGPKCTIFDIGANIGWYTLNIAKAFPDATVFAFEPIPSSFGYLERNVALNGLANVRPYCFGFSNKEAEAELYFYPDASGASSGANILDRADVQRIACPMKTVDGFLAGRDVKVDVIKCDVEGAELFVIEGAMHTLRQHRPMIFAEMLRKWAAKFGYSPNQMMGLLASIGYACYYVQEGHLRNLPRMEDSTAETNFFFLHPEKHADQIQQLVVRT